MGRVTDGVGVRGGADDDRLVDLHDWSLDGVGERASGGGPHVHHHAALSRWDLLSEVCRQRAYRAPRTRGLPTRAGRPRPVGPSRYAWGMIGLFRELEAFHFHLRALSACHDSRLGARWQHSAWGSY